MQCHLRCGLQQMNILSTSQRMKFDFRLLGLSGPQWGRGNAQEKRNPFLKVLDIRIENRGTDPPSQLGEQDLVCVSVSFWCLFPAWCWMFHLLTSDRFEMSGCIQLVVSSKVWSLLCLGFSFIVGDFLGTAALGNGRCSTGDWKGDTFSDIFLFLFFFKNLDSK